MSKTFIFHESIDVERINDLYADDYQMIEEVFASVYDELTPLTDAVIACYTAGDVPALKSAVHKIKPLFGFVGITAIEGLCLDFENTCQKNPSAALLENEFTLLKDSLLSGKTILAEEKRKLRSFLQS
jgi:hypothetical protein